MPLSSVPVSQSYKKIFHAVNPSNTTQWNINISGIDFTKFAYIDVYSKILNATGTSTYNRVYLNNITNSNYYKGRGVDNSTIATQNGVCQAHIPTIEGDGKIVFLNFRAHMRGNAICSEYTDTSDSDNEITSFWVTTYTTSIKVSNLSSINIFSDTGLNILANSEITIYGAKL